VSSIWLVDDEPLIRHAVISVLEDLGHETQGFGDAETLYRRLVESGQLPDLLILDHMLPDEDGAQIAHSLRERAEYRDVPILFLTAVDDESAQRLADLAPVLRKPFDFRDLIAEVDRLIGATQTTPGDPIGSPQLDS
jgi:DNA-binding response OmpR family regulator